MTRAVRVAAGVAAATVFAGCTLMFGLWRLWAGDNDEEWDSE